MNSDEPKIQEINKKIKLYHDIRYSLISFGSFVLFGTATHYRDVDAIYATGSLVYSTVFGYATTETSKDLRNLELRKEILEK